MRVERIIASGSIEAGTTDSETVFFPLIQLRKEIQMGPEIKKWYKSKTLWFFVLTLLVSVAGLFGYTDFAPTTQQAEILGVIISVFGVVLRLINNEPVV